MTASPLEEIEYVLRKLHWMESQKIWPNGLRYLWTDAFGVVLLASLFDKIHDRWFLDRAEWVVSEVDRVLGRPIGYRIGEEADRDGQYFHYLAMWIYALMVLGKYDRQYQERAVRVAREIHPYFVRPRIGVTWKMLEDLSGPYPGYGLGALDPFHGYVVYRLLAPDLLAKEIEVFRSLVAQFSPQLRIDQDLGLGMMLWMTHFFPEEPWAKLHRSRSLEYLDRLWIPSAGYFCRQLGAQHVRFAFTNYGVSLGLQAVQAWPERVNSVNTYFEHFRSGDEYDTNAITHVMACTSRFPGLLLTGKR